MSNRKRVGFLVDLLADANKVIVTQIADISKLEALYDQVIADLGNAREDLALKALQFPGPEEDALPAGERGELLEQVAKAEALAADRLAWMKRKDEIIDRQAKDLNRLAEAQQEALREKAEIEAKLAESQENFRICLLNKQAAERERVELSAKNKKLLAENTAALTTLTELKRENGVLEEERDNSLYTAEATFAEANQLGRRSLKRNIVDVNLPDPYWTLNSADEEVSTYGSEVES